MVFDKISFGSDRQPVNWLPVWGRALVWFVCYWIITTGFWLSLTTPDQPVGDPANWTIARWLGGGHLVLLFIAYYWITRVIFPTIVREGWLYAFLQSAGIYMMTGLVTYFFYIQVGKSFIDDNEQLSTYYRNYVRAGPVDSITDLSIFVPNWWLYSILLTAVALKVSREVFHVQNRALRIEMNLLRAQINPHFLFNTLNNIYSIVEEKDPYAAEILLKFGDFMRYTLHETDNNFIGLHREVDMLHEYIELERIRHDESAPARITFDVSGDTRDLVVPPLLLITLVENAFKHGTHATIGPSWVRIRLETEGQKVFFEVSNSKPPVPPAPPARHKLNVHRVGLANIRRRLDLLYPAHHKLLIADTPDIYTITITLLKHGHTHLLLSR